VELGFFFIILLSNTDIRPHLLHGQALELSDLFYKLEMQLLLSGLKGQYLNLLQLQSYVGPTADKKSIYYYVCLISI
jgi:hypothetical protein